LPIEILEVPSELVAVIAALNELFDSLGNQFRLQQEFIANAAHQLRTPVTAVQTYTEHLGRLELTTSQRAVVNGLSLASSRQTAMVNGLLLLAQIEATPASANEVTDLTAAVAEASVGLLQRAKDRHVELIFDMPVDSVYVQSNGFQLFQLVSNLLENAIKYTPENGSVWVFVSQDFDGLISLIVEDTGPGIPLEHRESVFQRFFRVPGATDAGSGLGLAIVKEIATTSNAKIQLSERFGGGSSFRVIFNQCGKFAPHKISQ
jgi:signal transduction histidine kinase